MAHLLGIIIVWLAAGAAFVAALAAGLIRFRERR